MEGLIIFVVIVLLSTAIGAVSQVLKGQQQAEQARAARARANARVGATPRPDTDRPVANPIDKFLQEIDKLRQKNGEGGTQPPQAAPVAPRIDRETPVSEGDRSVPTVRPIRKPRPEQPVPVAPRVSRPETPAARLPIARVEDLPVAPVIPPAASTSPLLPPHLGAPQRAKPAGATSMPRVTKHIPKQPRTVFGNQFLGLLSSRQTVPLAFVLQEVLGTPKCKRRSS